MLSRRSFLSAGLSFAPLLYSKNARAEVGGALGNSTRLQTISVLHTTDLHGHIFPTTSYQGVSDLGGFARCASQIRRWRQEDPNALLLDVGDVYQGTEHSFTNEGKHMIELFNLLNYDAWTIGNHEFDWGAEVLRSAIQTGNMPALGANLALAEGVDRNAWQGLQPSLIREIGELKIGVVGVCTPGLAAWLPAELRDPISALDPVEVVFHEANRLREEEGVHIVVCSSHMGLRGHMGIEDNHANRIQGLLELDNIDLILGGHTHQDFPGSQKNGVWYSQAGYHGLSCGKVELTWDHENNRLYDVRCSTRLMDSRIELDPEVVAESLPLVEESEQKMELPLGVLGHDLSVRFDSNKPCGVARLLAEAIAFSLEKQGTQVDAVLHGVFTDTIERSGEKTIADAWRLVPYDNSLVTIQISVAELKAVVSQALSFKRSLIGLGFVLNSEGEVIEISNGEGEILADQERVCLAVNAYDSQSGGRRLPLLAQAVENPENQRQFHPIQTRQALISLFAEHPELSLLEEE